MRSVVYLVACTLDGFIAASDGSIDAFVADPIYLHELFRRFPETCPAPLRGPFEVDDDCDVASTAPRAVTP